MFSENVVICNYILTIIIIIVLDWDHAQREKDRGGLFVRNHPALAQAPYLKTNISG